MIPIIGLGTWQLKDEICTRAVKMALAMGYRHIDTAHYYENHKAIAKGLVGFPREELFLTSKIAPDQIDDKNAAKSVEKACDLALKELKVDYLDLWLIHWYEESKPMLEIVAAMEKQLERGKVRSIGVSNYSIEQIQKALDAGLKISANQVEFHPFLYQKELWDYCRSRQIQLVSYRSLGKGALLQEPLFHEIGKKYSKTAAQVILRWLVQKEIPVIPKASTEQHLKENLQIFDFTLTPQEMESIDMLDRGLRFCPLD